MSSQEMLSHDKDGSDEVFLAGYTDRLSGRPGNVIRFFVSCQLTSKEKSRDVSTRFVRSISADPNPKGPGIVEVDASKWFPCMSFRAKHQSIPAGGSYARTKDPVSCADNRKVSIDLWLYSTSQSTFRGSRQFIWSWGRSLFLSLNSEGNLEVSSDSACILHATSFRLPQRKWLHCFVVLDRVLGRVSMKAVDRRGKLIGEESQSIMGVSAIATQGYFGLATGGTFNGRLESPRIMDSKDRIVAQWDTSINMSGWSIPGQSQTMKSISPLQLYQHPTRGVKGRRWDGTEFCWKHRPDHYGAIHFHDDDCYDFGWNSDFSWTIPVGIPSGIYILHLTAKDDDGMPHTESLPIFICPPLEHKPRKEQLCVLVSTFTYVVYGNHARSDFDATAWTNRVREWGAYPHSPVLHPCYGLSTYNFHSDGSGIHFASHQRPLFSLRPSYVSLAHTSCSGLRHFPADSHLISFLHHQGMEYDVVTDHELHQRGVAALSGYSILLTGSHPEYHSLETLNALQSFRDDHKGNLLYLGGNGFYWRIAVAPPLRSSEDEASLLEIRRAEDGVRTWASEPGEYHHVLDPAASYGGLWRRNDRAPQKLVGVGFAAQGGFAGKPYRRRCHDPGMDWIWKGISKQDLESLGNFGFSGGGAAGFEWDRVDRRLDEDSHEVMILAQAYDPEKAFMFVPEEVLTTYSNLSGLPEDEARRCDMVYFETESGARVFSVGSITFCGCLPWNNFDNCIATLLKNVILEFISGENARYNTLLKTK